MPESPIAALQRTARRTAIQAALAASRDLDEAVIADVLAGRPASSDVALGELEVAVAAFAAAETAVALLGLDEERRAQLVEDAVAIVREEWTRGVEPRDLIPV